MIETIQGANFNWHHLTSPTDEDLTQLQQQFGFHPLDIEDCRSKTQRPKVDEYEDYYFIILHFPYFDKNTRFISTKEVKIFWGEKYIITIGNSHWIVKDLFNKYQENTEQLTELVADTSDSLLYKILEQLTSETMYIILRVGNVVNIINNELFDKHSKKTIERISVTRKNIIMLNTIIKPQLRLFHKFESGDIGGFSKDMEDYWGNILDKYQKSWDLIEDYEELIAGLSTTFDSLQANKMNEIMKILTFISTTLLPLTFLTGLYGMNIGLPLQNHPHSFLILVITMVLIVGFLIIFFKKKKWM